MLNQNNLAIVNDRGMKKATWEEFSNASYPTKYSLNLRKYSQRNYDAAAKDPIKKNAILLEI